MHIVDAETTAAALPFGELVDALASGFAEGCQLPVRHHHTMQREGEPDATLLLMPAWSNGGDPEQYLGIKLVTVVPGNAARQLPGLVSTYLLFDALTGQQLAMMDGNTVTSRRTAATSALAARMLAPETASRLLVVGAGRVGSLLPHAYRAVRQIREVAIYDINPTAAQAMGDRLRDEGIDATIAEDLETAVRKADIVTCATLSTSPLVKGEWLHDGAHLDLIGGFTPKMREADDAAIAGSALYLDTQEALHEAGDICQPIASGAIAESRVRGTLAQLVRNEVAGRRPDDHITCFKAVGSGLADLVAARLVYRAGASVENAGNPITFSPHKSASRATDLRTGV